MVFELLVLAAAVSVVAVMVLVVVVVVLLMVPVATAAVAMMTAAVVPDRRPGICNTTSIKNYSKHIIVISKLKLLPLPTNRCLFKKQESGGF